MLENQYLYVENTCVNRYLIISAVVQIDSRIHPWKSTLEMGRMAKPKESSTSVYWRHFTGIQIVIQIVIQIEI